MEKIAPETLLYLLYAAAAVWTIWTYLRRKHRLLSAMLGAGSGIAVLTICHMFGGNYGLALPLNLHCIAVSAVGGVPAVLLLLLLMLVTK